MKKMLFLIGLLMIISNSQNSYGAANANDTIKVLWVGNSYTFYNDLPDLTADIAKENGVIMENTKVLKGGEKLSGHLQNPVLHEELKKGGWDYIILQEFSSGPAASTKSVAQNIYPYAEAIDSIAHTYSPDAKTILYMTWGHKNGNVRQDAYPLDDDYENMQERIKTTYIDLAYDLDAWCAPVGIAWQNVRSKYPEIELYVPDDFHPSLAGSWLAANALFSTIYQKPFSSAFPSELNEEEAAILQKEAQEAFFDNLKVLNIK